MFGFSRPSDMIRQFASNKTRRSKYVFGFGGCYFDLNAAIGTDTKTNAASVTTWIEQVNGYIFTSLTNRPTFVVSDSNFNNQPSISFGASARLSAISPVGVPGNFTILAVLKTDIIQSRNIAFNDQASSEKGLLMAGNTVGINAIGYYEGSTMIAAGSTEDTAAHIVALTPTSVWVDGVKEGSPSPFKCSSVAQVGGAANVALRGPMARLFILDHALSDNEMPILFANVNAQYLVY